MTVTVVLHYPRRNDSPEPARVFMGPKAVDNAKDYVSRCTFPDQWEIHEGVPLEVTDDR
jgi:hypothetical protein